MVFFAYLGFFVFALLLIILIIGLSLMSTLFGGIRNILRLFGFGNRQKTRHRTSSQTSYSHQGTSYTQQHASQAHNDASNGKIFGSNEGEYVEFEEIK